MGTDQGRTIVRVHHPHGRRRLTVAYTDGTLRTFGPDGHNAPVALDRAALHPYTATRGVDTHGQPHAWFDGGVPGNNEVRRGGGVISAHDTHLGIITVHADGHVEADATRSIRYPVPIVSLWPQRASLAAGDIDGGTWWMGRTPNGDGLGIPTRLRIDTPIRSVATIPTTLGRGVVAAVFVDVDDRLWAWGRFDGRHLREPTVTRTCGVVAAATHDGDLWTIRTDGTLRRHTTGTVANPDGPAAHRFANTDGPALWWIDDDENLCVTEPGASAPTARIGHPDSDTFALFWQMFDPCRDDASSPSDLAATARRLTP